jgi:hypothetical protein
MKYLQENIYANHHRACSKYGRAGRSASAIAAKIGSTPGSVRVKCSHLKITLRRSKRLQQTQRGAEHLVVVDMPGPLYTAFHRKAVHMNKSDSVLAGLLLEAIITGDASAVDRLMRRGGA